jgi:acyl-CoA reductase-like NAD-dependent aldehyde dehydrogenase
VIAPWNYPYLTAANTIVPALLAGNAVLLKPAAQTPLTGERFAEALAQAGLPAGLFANLFLDHDHDAGAGLARLVDHATFTGSVEGGRAVEQAPRPAPHHLTLELGGKDPAYVRADADWRSAIEGLADGAFFNSGQSCCGVERLYVGEAVWTPFLDGLVEATPPSAGQSARSRKRIWGRWPTKSLQGRVRAQVSQAKAAGRDRSCPDPRLFPADSGDAAYLMPQC